MDSHLFEMRVNHLVTKVKHYLISRWGKLHDHASCELFYEAFSFSFREEVMTNWTACFNSYLKNNSRMVYFLSMEYLPGKILSHAIMTLNAEAIVKEAMKRLGRSYDEIMHQEREPGLGNGGLGRLASCFLDSLATLKIPAIGYGLRYQYGTFEQEICYGNQLERPDRWLDNPYPWEFRRNDRTYTIEFGGHLSQVDPKNPEQHPQLIDSEEVRAIAFDIPIVGHSPHQDYSVATMRLWSTKESPRNFRLQIFNTGKLDEAAENTHLTDILYPNDNHDVGKRFRLKQEFLLVSASLQDIYRRHLAVNPNLTNLAEKASIQINDTHPALLVAEMMRTLTQNYEIHWDHAWEITSSCIHFTNHTVMAEALEEWKISRLEQLLPRQYKVIQRINEQFNQSLQSKNLDEKTRSKLQIIDHEHVRMANLAIYGSKRVNGVAKLHTNILKEHIFKEFYALYPDKFINITNGVTPRRWLLHCNPLLKEFITKHIGPNWEYDFELIKDVHQIADRVEVQDEFLEIKRKNKLHAAEFINKYNSQFRSYDPFVQNMSPLGPDSLYDMHIKRIHEYKRQLLKLIHAIMLYQEIIANPSARKVKRTIFFGGKAAAGYEKAREMIYLTHILAKKINQDPRANQQLRVLFVENYNVNKAEILIPAADLSEQISMAGKEASGTGNMKLAMNGALTIGTEDGANIEMREAVSDQWWPFRFGATKEEVEELKKSLTYNPNQIYQNSPHIKKALDALKDGTFGENDFEKKVLAQFYHYLVEGFNPDPYLVIHDLNSYYEVQKKVEALYLEPRRWAEFALHNIASMTSFSSDVSIKKYAQEIWNIEPTEMNSKELEKIRQEFDSQNSCLASVNGNSHHPESSWQRIKKIFKR